MTDWLRAKLQKKKKKKLQHMTALIKIDHNFMKMWRLRKHCLNFLTLSFANEETEVHKGKKISKDTTHLVTRTWNSQIPENCTVCFLTSRTM